jgi:DNA polymerase-1
MVFEADDVFVAALVSEVKSRMEAAATLRVPLVVDTGIGANWDEAH